MGANKSKVQNKLQNDMKNKIQNNEPHILQNKGCIENIRSKYILKKIFDHLNQRRCFKLINYNKNIQNRLEIGIKDYHKEYIKIIKLEIIPSNNCNMGMFINYIDIKDNYHIYFDEEKGEIKINIFTKKNKPSKIKMVLNFDYDIKSLKGLFKDCDCIEKITFIKFDRNDFIDTSYLFYGCTSLNKIDLSNIKTKNVKDMSFMFYHCESLKELNLSNFDTKEVTNMKSIFSRCSSLEKIDLSHFNTQNVKDMSYMFNECYSLNDLDLSGFKNKNLKNMGYMFYGCSSLKELNIINFEFNIPINKELMFFGCSSLQILNIDNYDERDVDYNFKGCPYDIIYNLKNELL